MTGIASRSQLRMSFLRYALVTVPLVLLLGTLMAKVSGSGAENPWYAALAKPQLTPPGWVFPVAWTLIYVLIGLALALVLHARGARGRGVAVGVFLAQLALNYAWSPIFFAAHEVGLALVVIVLMIVLAGAAALLFARIRKAAGLLMVPYLAWLCFAAFLTWQIGELNPQASQLVPAPASADIPL
ncbi:MAG TPA: TspO/MBR family protein [Allosphingosinicella sp.]|jgi:tryptophan-rich sensory protein